MSECEVCTHPRAREIMMSVFKGDMTYIDASRSLNLPVDSVWNCMKDHWKVEKDGSVVTLQAVREARTAEDFVALMRKAVQKFLTRLENAFEMPVSAYNESAVTRLSAELRALMRDILEFEGKLHSAPTIQLNIMQVQMTKLTSYLFSELCEADRLKLMKALPEMMTLQAPAINTS